MLIRTIFSRELFLLGVRELHAHKLRSFLTALGMIFGVGAVICMLAIGEGGAAEQLESIRLLGSRNIIIRSAEPPQTAQSDQQNTVIQTYGLLRDDVERLSVLPHVVGHVMMREVADTMLHGSRKFEGSVLGTTPNFFEVVNVRLARGRALADEDAVGSAKVCVIGADIARLLFEHEDALGRTITVVSPSTNPIPYQVVGILGDVTTAGTPAKGKGGRNLNKDMYIPLATCDFRYGDMKVRWSRGRREIKKVQVSDVYLQVDEDENVMATSRLAARALEHAHKQLDYTLTVPLELLQQAEQSKRTWQIVLGSIAGISLLVGGIGIMNIMLASVTERTREIGIRRALGARKVHITAQFLIETLILSLGGGIIGVVLGIGLAWVVTWFADWQTIIPWWGVLLSFVVSALVGISFGLYPARRAAALDPIEALRYQ